MNTNVFKKIDAVGAFALADSTSHPIVLQENAGLMWSAAPIGDVPLNADEADARLPSIDLGGFQDWRKPTVEELFLLHDRTRCDPAIDTAFFTCPPGWYHTASPAAWSPRSDVWIVYSDDGVAYCSLRNDTAWLRVCRSVSAPASGQ